MTIAGTNTNTLTSSINILEYGSVYQSGYVFAIDDSTPNTGSIGGKVAALTDQAVPSPNGIIWSSNGNSGGAGDVVYDDIPGIYETATNPPDACNGNADGTCDTQVIAGYYSSPTPINPSYYAAGVCKQTLGGYSDWYLPAICEMGYDPSSLSGSGCGTAASPAIQNMQSNLVDNGNIGGLGHDYYYWSSTESSANPVAFAFYENFGDGGGSLQSLGNKNLQIDVRCARAMTN